MPLFVSIGFDVYMNSNAIQRKSNTFEPTFIEIASCVLSNTHTNNPLNDHLQTSKCHGKTIFTASLLNFLIKTHIKRGNLTENTITLNCDPYSKMCAQNLEAHAIFDVLFVFCEIYHF